MPLQKRRAIAERIDHALGGLPEVTAVYVFGSVASGHADSRSDVDMGFVCSREIPRTSTRRGALAGVGSDWRFDVQGLDNS